MQKIVFTEEFCHPENLYPFTLTRQLQDIRIGILTIREKWEFALGLVSYDKWEDDYKDLDRAIRFDASVPDDVFIMIHGNVFPSAKLIKAVKRLNNGEFLSVNGNDGIVFRFTKKEVVDHNKIRVSKAVIIKEKPHVLQYPWEIFQMNAWAIREDFGMITAGRKSQRIPPSNTVVRPGQIFLEKGARVENTILNASTGPIYIGRNAEIMDGCIVRGPFAMGEKAVLKMGTKVYGATSLGPGCVGGGEIKNAVLFGYSNKAHDGYLGDSVIGEWCNLGAGTSNSNLKNTAGDVMLWTPNGQVNVGQKCGVLMGDYSRTMINTSLNTGTVIGVSCNVFGAGLTPKYLPAFSWGNDGIERYRLENALTDIDNWKKLKGQSLTAAEETILKYIYEHY